MIRKLFKILKAAIVGAVWTVVFVYAARIIMISIWNFDILNMRDWQVINTFWESGGKIKTGRDYLFVGMLLALIPLWFWGWRFFYRLSFVKILLFPITWYNNRMIRKYGENMPRIILKNMGAAKSKPNMEEIIEQRLKESAKPREKETGKIRRSIQEKISASEKK